MSSTAPEKTKQAEIDLTESTGLTHTWADVNDLFERWLRAVPFSGPLFDRLPRPGFIKTEEYDDGKSYVVRAEMPGLDPDEDIDITLDSGRLTIEARREERRTEEEEGKVVRSEFEYGSFRRSIPVPASIDVDEVEATYSDGILEVKVPVSTPEEPRSIPVERG